MSLFLVYFFFYHLYICIQKKSKFKHYFIPIFLPFFFCFILYITLAFNCVLQKNINKNLCYSLTLFLYHITHGIMHFLFFHTLPLNYLVLRFLLTNRFSYFGCVRWKELFSLNFNSWEPLNQTDKAREICFPNSLSGNTSV